MTSDKPADEAAFDATDLTAETSSITDASVNEDATGDEGVESAADSVDEVEAVAENEADAVAPVLPEPATTAETAILSSESAPAPAPAEDTVSDTTAVLAAAPATPAAPATQPAASTAAPTETPSAPPTITEAALPVQPVWEAAPKQRRRRRWPWIVAPLAVVAAATAASTLLIAPGVQAAGVPLGGLTRDAAERAIAERLAQTSVEFETPSGTVSLSAADLGATVDASGLAAEAHDDHPLWKIGSWGGSGIAASIAIDEAKTAEALRTEVAGSYVAPTEATVAFDGSTFIVTPSQDGSGIPAATVQEALQRAFDAGETTVTASSEVTAVEPVLTTAEAETAANTLNGLLGTIGFYVGDERTVPIDAATAVSWMTYTIADDGSVAIDADADAVQKSLDAVAATVNRPASAGTIYVDSNGTPLEPYTDDWYDGPYGASTPGIDGRTVGDTVALGKKFAEQIDNADGRLELPVAVVEAEETKVERRIEVNLTEQTTYVWEGGKVIKTFVISSGRDTPATETHTGQFRTSWRTPEQDLGCSDNFSYCTEDVPWVMYFNGDEAFHGTYWHNNFGTRMSHGCVNMRIEDAKWLYYWAPNGTEVWVHN